MLGLVNLHPARVSENPLATTCAWPGRTRFGNAFFMNSIFEGTGALVPTGFFFFQLEQSLSSWNKVFPGR